jgi:NAD(P)-dependent dehydrogenase (short-subunit alcohol dehydrogenase family)
MTGRVAVVTGAGRGIGRAVALAFGAAGDRVVVAARSGDELAEVAGAVEAGGGQALAVACDVTSEAEVEDLMNRAADRSAGWSGAEGRLDVVVCAAGVARVKPFPSLSLAEWNESLATNLTGTFLTCRAAVGRMGRGGHLIVLSSIAGRSGFPEWSAYSAAKFGVLGFAEAIRAELRPRGIRVTAVIPGAVDTGLWHDVPGEWNRANMLQPADVARAVVRVVDEPAHVSVDEVVLGHIAGVL